MRTRRLSARELVSAFIARIEALNARLNALCTFVPEQALAEARRLDRRLAHAKTAPALPLAGLPVAFKDLVPTRGLRTTYGSLVYRDHVPAEDHVIVERMRAAGAVIVGKTNTPEFGAGSQTYNAVFGATRNPYDPSKTCGGSSGGAAVAVATGMLPFADGSDLGASLRNPASFCNVVGLRPTPGRVPSYPADDAWDTLSVLGPIARRVEDAAFLLSVMAGPDPRAPASLCEPGAPFARLPVRDFRATRIAWSRDLGGLPVDPRVTAVFEAQRPVFEAMGCRIHEAEPDLAEAGEAFHVLRALAFARRYGALLRAHQAQLKDTVVWNIEEGLRLRPERIGAALAARSRLFHAMREFLERYDFLVLPTSQVPPFPVAEPWVRAIAGRPMPNYLEWMRSCYAITMTSHPAISVPAGFTRDDPPLPVGIQIVGRYRDERTLLAFALAFERANPVWRRRPPL